VPACSDPIVTTAESVGATSRETIVCSRITVAAAIITGSMLDSGIGKMHFCSPTQASQATLRQSKNWKRYGKQTPKMDATESA
jgi:hypothetical protein